MFMIEFQLYSVQHPLPVHIYCRQRPQFPSLTPQYMVLSHPLGRKTRFWMFSYLRKTNRLYLNLFDNGISLKYGNRVTFCFRNACFFILSMNWKYLTTLRDQERQIDPSRVSSRCLFFLHRFLGMAQADRPIALAYRAPHLFLLPILLICQCFTFDFSPRYPWEKTLLCSLLHSSVQEPSLEPADLTFLTAWISNCKYHERIRMRKGGNLEQKCDFLRMM